MKHNRELIFKYGLEGFKIDPKHFNLRILSPTCKPVFPHKHETKKHQSRLKSRLPIITACFFSRYLTQKSAWHLVWGKNIFFLHSDHQKYKRAKTVQKLPKWSKIHQIKGQKIVIIQFDSRQKSSASLKLLHVLLLNQ